MITACKDEDSFLIFHSRVMFEGDDVERYRAIAEEFFPIKAGYNDECIIEAFIRKGFEVYWAMAGRSKEHDSEGEE